MTKEKKTEVPNGYTHDARVDVEASLLLGEAKDDLLDLINLVDPPADQEHRAGNVIVKIWAAAIVQVRAEVRDVVSTAQKTPSHRGPV